MQKIDTVCPGFAVDCLETLEEVSLRYAEAFRNAGGDELRYIPALNETPQHVDFLAGLIARHAAGPDGALAQERMPERRHFDAGGAK